MKLQVSIYNQHHRDLLKFNPQYEKLIELENNELTIPNEDFLIYCLFNEQKQHTGFRTFNDFRRKLPSRIELLQDYLDLSSPTITAKFKEVQEQQIITERIGIGAGLSVISHLHGLTEADWNIKAVTKKKDLDYHISADDENIIEVECKGTLMIPM